jgi:hypothetical protein
MNDRSCDEKGKVAEAGWNARARAGRRCWPTVLAGGAH